MSISHTSFARVPDIVVRTGLKRQRRTTLVWNSEKHFHYPIHARCLSLKATSKTSRGTRTDIATGVLGSDFGSIYGNRGLESHELLARAAGNPDLTPGDFPDPPPQNKLRLRREDAIDTWAHTV